jgi:polynucleotide 5'-triphosphatase
MEDREIPVEEPRRVEHHDVKPQVNGDHRIPSSSPQQPPKKRTRYTEPPIWAQSVRNRGGVGFASKVNGKQLAAVVQSQVGPSPLVKAETNGNRQVSPAAARQAPPVEIPANHPSALLGPWEESITGKKPFEQMTKLVADFLYMNVVSRGDLGELASRGVEIEIEAKLGQLIDKETNERYYLPVRSECILRDGTRVGFRSSMTEVCALANPALPSPLPILNMFAKHLISPNTGA